MDGSFRISNIQYGAEAGPSQRLRPKNPSSGSATLSKSMTYRGWRQGERKKWSNRLDFVRGVRKEVELRHMAENRMIGKKHYERCCGSEEHISEDDPWVLNNSRIDIEIL